MKNKVKKKLRVQWHSVSPTISSGYGNVTREVTTRIAREGYFTIVSAYYGIEPGGILEKDGVWIFPVDRTTGQWGRKSCVEYYRRFNMDICFLHTDFWAFDWFTKDIPRPFSYCAFDSINYPEDLQQLIREYEGVVTFCKFAHDEIKKYGVESTVIPHGVDTKVFKPLNKLECRKKFGYPEDVFIIGKVAANADKENGCRKGWVYELYALRQFLDNNPDVKNIKMVCHTNPSDIRGYPLLKLVHKLKLDNIVTFYDPAFSVLPISSPELATLYNTFDVFTLCSMREGFGLTALEAMSCGIPVVAHNFSSLPELVKGHGWLVRSKGWIDTPIGATTYFPDIDDIEKKYYDAYFDDKTRNKYSRLSRKFALKYDWDRIFETGWKPYLQRLNDELEDKPLKKRRIV